MLYLNHAFPSKFLCGVWLMFFFPSHLLAGRDPALLAGVCITEQHGSMGPVLPLSLRLCIGLVTAEIKYI